jgi:molybdopterin-guanine dinucleotide biosynthesis protein A
MGTGTTTRTLAVILAGGLARRMGGGDKGLSLLAGRTILARIIERIAPQVDAVVLNANDDPGRFWEFGVPVIADTLPGRPGPLAGILAGLDHAAGDYGRVLAVPCDAPVLPRDLVARLQAAAGQGGAVATSGGRRHPAVAMWPVSARDALRAALVERDVRRVDTVQRKLRFAQADWPAEPFDPFLNINDQEGLDRAAELLERFPTA